MHSPGKKRSDFTDINLNNSSKATQDAQKVPAHTRNISEVFADHQTCG